MVFRVFLDANVLIPGRIRDVLLSLAEVRIFEPLWSEEVLIEVRRNLPDSMSEDDKDALFWHMESAFPEAKTAVPRGALGIYDGIINDKDRHVIAAAFLAKAELLLTSDKNLRNEVREFPWLDAQDLPEFIAYSIDADIDRARDALVKMARNRWVDDESLSSEEIIFRLRKYFEKSGWSPESL